MILGELWLSPTNQRFEIDPLFDWHELNMSADFVRWTNRRVETMQEFRYNDENYQAKVTMYDASADDMIRMEVETRKPFSIRSVLIFAPYIPGASTPRK